MNQSLTSLATQSAACHGGVVPALTGHFVHIVSVSFFVTPFLQTIALIRPWDDPSIAQRDRDRNHDGM